MFQTKICGLTTLDDALAAAAAGADAIGLNFYPPSPRYVTPETASALAAALPSNVTRVGVFVNETADVIERLCRSTPLDMVQLHGDESPEFAAELTVRLAPRPIVRAFRCSLENVDQACRWLEEAERLGALPLAVLVDAWQPGQFGGTGVTVDAEVAVRLRSRFPALPLILAGGLKAENVAERIAASRPDAVDTASGVESSPGRKDVDQMRRFVQSARQSLK